MAVERRGEQALALPARGALVERGKAHAIESRLVHLDDEGAQLRRVAVVMGVELPALGFDEGLRQRVEALGGAEPGEAVAEMAHAGAEAVGQAAPHQRVDAVGRDHQVEAVELGETLHRAPIDRRDADRARPRLQQPQQMQPADGGKADAVDDDALALEVERHVAPGFHVRHDRRIGLLVVLAEEFERAVGEHHAEAEGGVRRVLLDHA